MTTLNPLASVEGQNAIATAIRETGTNIINAGISAQTSATAAATSANSAAESATAAAASATAAAGSVTQTEAIKNAMIAAYGYPLTAATASAMTDTTKIYVYTGSETGYTFGDWYYYNGNAWTDGGVYNAIAFNTDPTLTISGAAADAKATGDAVSDLNQALSQNSYNLVSGRKSGYAIGSNGKINRDPTNDTISAPVEANKKYFVTTGETGLVCGFFTSDPFAEDATSYDGNRIIQNSHLITAPISGYIAFRTPAGYTTPQVTEGETEQPYIPPITAYDRIASAKVDKLEAKQVLLKINGEIKDGYIRYSDGVILGTSPWKYYEFPVSYGMTVYYATVNATMATYNMGLAFYDKHKQFISGYIIDDADEQNIAVPQNAVLCRATVEDESDIGLYGYNEPIALIEETLNGVGQTLKPFSNNAIKTSDNYINYSNGNVIAYAALSYYTYDVIGGGKITYKAINSNPDARGLAFYDANGIFIIGYQMLSTSQDINIPTSAVTLKATAKYEDDIEFFNYLDTINSKMSDDMFAPPTEPIGTIKDEVGMLSLFLNVGCIGDSLASGEAYWNEGGTVQGADFYEYSWGQFLARQTGNKYYNWSKGGLSTITWYESEYATECYDGEHLCQAYIIGLGQNDYNAHKSAGDHSTYIGTSADINLSDYTQNANSFYGNYAKIIQRIQSINPKAKIFVITDMNPYVNREGYNVPIRDMANIFDNVYVVDLQAYGSRYYNSPILSAQMRGGHYNAYGYMLCSLLIANYINWIILTNPTEFTQVELILTPHSWTD